ncbi:LIM domain protein, partial [Opisthorchis viverrini]
VDYDTENDRLKFVRVVSTSEFQCCICNERHRTPTRSPVKAPVLTPEVHESKTKTIPSVEARYFAKGVNGSVVVMFCVFRINTSTRGVLVALVSIHYRIYSSAECKSSLETGGFYMKDDEFYCQKDYHRYFVAKCKACAKDLIGELVTVLDFSFHRECFKCTSCSITFHPGDRVTVWQERFFCPRCVGQQGAPVPPITPTKHKTNGTPLSPLSVTDDEGCCVSAADASLAEFPSPQDSGLSPCVTGNHLGDSKNVGEFRLPSSEAKCITSTGNPQKSKSILRKSGTDKLRVHESSRDHGGLSTDSGLGERVFGSKTPEAQVNGFYSQEPTNGVNYTATPPVLSSTTLSLNNSRQGRRSCVHYTQYPHSSSNFAISTSFRTKAKVTKSWERVAKKVVGLYSYNAVFGTLKEELVGEG